MDLYSRTARTSLGQGLKYIAEGVGMPANTHALQKADHSTCRITSYRPSYAHHLNTASNEPRLQTCIMPRNNGIQHAYTALVREARHLQRRAEEEELIVIYWQCMGCCYDTKIPDSKSDPTMTNNIGSQLTVTSSVYLSG